MVEPVLSAHACLRFEEAEALVLQWFDEVGLTLGHAEHGRLIAWFDDVSLYLPSVAEIAVEVQIYALAEGWSQLRWQFHHGGSEQICELINDIFDTLLQVLRSDGRWHIDLCHARPEQQA
ncbi:MAG: hypothetical protein WAM11_15440 [Cyanobium sp.]